MNKLISRNPVQRFKQGRKIIFAQGGNKTYYEVTEKSKIPTTKPKEELRNGYMRINNNGKWAWGRYDSNGNFVPITKEVVLDDGTILNINGTRSTVSARNAAKNPKVIERGYIDSNGNKTLLGASTDDVNKKARANITPNKVASTNYTRDAGYNDRYGLAGDIQRNWRGTKGVIADNDLKLLQEMGFQIQDQKNAAREAQQFIRDNGLGQYNVALDNAWGGQSSDALKSVYQMWKAKKEADEAAESLKPVVKKPSSTIQLPEVPTTPRPAMSNYIYYAKNLKQALGENNNFSGLSNLVWKEYADDDDSFAANFSRDMRTRFKNYGTQQSWLDNQAAIEKLLNISGRYKGTRAGDYGDIANSMAKWAGEYNYNNVDKPLNYYNAIIDKYKRTIGGYKMGGLLPSRNIIERFKQGRKIIFAQGGTYFPVTVGGRTYQYNPYNGSYKGAQGSGQNISYEDIEGAFNKQYEGVSHSGSKVYRRRGSHTTWTNSAGKQVNLALAKKAQPNTSFKTSANGRFRVVDQTSGKELRFDSRDEAKRYQMSAPKQQQGTRVIYDDEKESKGQVIRVDRTKEKATEYGRRKLESNNNLSFKQAYQEGRKSGNKYFSYKGKVYKTDLENGKNNMDEMIELYGNNLGYSSDPNLNNKKSVAAREQYRKDANAKQGNRNANYKGKTNSQANAEADKNFDKELGLSTLPVQFTDAMAPLGNLQNLALTLADPDYKPEIIRSGLNPFGYVYDAIKGNTGGLGTRALDLTAHFGLPGARTLMVKAAPKIPVPTYLQKLYHGDASSTNWVINGLNRAQGKVKNFFTRMVPTKGNGHFGTYSVEASEHISPSVTSVINNGTNQYITGNPNAVQPLYTKLANTVVDPRSWHIADWVNDYSNNNY